MALWVLSFCIMAVEAWGSIYFLDTFLKKKSIGQWGKCRYVVLYFAGMAVALFGGYFDLMGIRAMLIILVLSHSVQYFMRQAGSSVFSFPC